MGYMGSLFGVAAARWALVAPLQSRYTVTHSSIWSAIDQLAALDIYALPLWIMVARKRAAVRPITGPS